MRLVGVVAVDMVRSFACMTLPGHLVVNYLQLHKERMLLLEWVIWVLEKFEMYSPSKSFGLLLGLELFLF